MKSAQIMALEAERTMPRQFWDDPASLRDIDEARDQILASFSPLAPVSTAILDALGMVLAESVVADTALPPFPNSAMDGFALRSADVATATWDSPIILNVIAEAPAGQPIDERLEPGAAVRIMTGAHLPSGADAVVRFEETDEGTRAGGGLPGTTVAIYRAVKPGANIRLAGEDVAAGEVVVAAGTIVRPAAIGLLAAIGRCDALVHRRPKVAILATGDEIVDPGIPLGPGQIHNSNSSIIAALTRRTGGTAIVLGVARDSRKVLKAKLAEAVNADLIITTGGVSAGDYDFVKDVLHLEGAIDLWQVRIKPGKPLAFGHVSGVPLLGLPGNPVAAAVAFEQFARPAIQTMLGFSDLTIPTIIATLLDRIDNRGGRRNFVRVRVEPEEPDGYVARLAGSQGSGILSSLSRCNGLLIVPEDLAVAEPGARLPVQMIDWNLG